ncbi:MAG: hypothetical protein WC547_11535, partial [Candidatus Omnitrophota bacterium]
MLLRADSLEQSLALYAMLLIPEKAISVKDLAAKLLPLLYHYPIEPENVVCAWSQMAYARSKKELLDAARAVTGETERFEASCPLDDYWLKRLRHVTGGDYSAEQRDVISTIAGRLSAAFFPAAPESERAALARSISERTKPASLQAVMDWLDAIPGLPFAPRTELEPRWYRDMFLQFSAALLTSHAVSIKHDPQDQHIFLVPGSGTFCEFVWNVAHEHVHGLLPEAWSVNRMFSREDWIADAAGAIVTEWLTQERQITFEYSISDLIGPVAAQKIYELGHAVAATVAFTRWPGQLRRFDSLPDNSRPYAQGIMIGGIARGLAQRIIADLRVPDRDAHQLALAFVAFFSRETRLFSFDEFAVIAEAFYQHIVSSGLDALNNLTLRSGSEASWAEELLSLASAYEIVERLREAFIANAQFSAMAFSDSTLSLSYSGPQGARSALIDIRTQRGQLNDILQELAAQRTALPGQIRGRAHNISGRGQIDAIAVHPEFAAQFAYNKEALSLIVTFAQREGEIDYRGPPEDFHVARSSPDGPLWFIVRSGDRRAAHALIRRALDGTQYDADYIIAQIELHESFAQEADALEAQCQAFKSHPAYVLSAHREKYAIESILVTIYAVAYDRYYQDKGWAISITDPVTSKTATGIIAHEPVKYGIFQPTPVQLMPQVLSAMNIRQAKSAFVIGSADGRTARMLASQGIRVVGEEQDQDIFSCSQEVKSYFPGAISEVCGKLHIDRSIAAQSFWATEVNIGLSCADVFSSGTDLSSFDRVYLYYPEPDQLRDFFNRELSRVLSDPAKGINDHAEFLMLRQFELDPIELKGLFCA